MKVCDICGNVNSRFNNFCFHCGNENYRRNICPKCGQLNEDTSYICSSCENILEPVKVEEIDFFLENYDYYNSLLENYDFTPEKYNQFLDDIFRNVDVKKIKGDSIKEVILSYASNFADCIPKSRSLFYGYCEGDILYYDDRLNDAIQTITIIHELSHVLLYKLVLYLFCDIFNVKPSSMMKGFAWFFLDFQVFHVLNEYIANSVESSFAPFQHHNYGSFWNVYKDVDLEDDELQVVFLLGNAIVDDFVTRLSNFINLDLRKQIEIQYIKDRENPNLNPPPTDNIEKLETEKICTIVINFLKIYYKKFAKPQSEDDLIMIEELENSIEKFKIKNK